MANLVITNSFSPNTTILSAQVNTNYSDISTYVNNRNSGTTAWDNVKSVAGITIQATTDQLVLGTTNTITITSPAPSSSRTITIPDPGASASFILTTTAQTITGAKTFADQTLLLQETGSTDVITINVASLAASRAYTLPDAGGSASFVMTAGTQSIAGVKTFSSQLIPSAGIKGISTNTDASAGNIGEYVTAVVGTTNAPTTNQWGDLTSISLTAGDWDVYGVADADINNATWTQALLGISTTSGNSATGLTAGQTMVQYQFASSATTPLILPLAIPFVRMSLSATTTVYLKMKCVYSAGQAIYDGGRISARRVQPGT